MKMLFINKLGHNEIKESEILPRIGDKVDMFYRPFPTVNQVLLWPSSELLKELRCDGLTIDAVITVE